MAQRNQLTTAVAVEDRPVDEREAAPYLGMTTSWLRKGRQTGTGPTYIRIGRTVRYRLRDLDAFLEQHRVRTRESA